MALVLRTALEQAEKAVEAERFELAGDFFRAGRIAAAKSGDRIRKLKPINGRAKEFEEVAAHFSRAMGALETLAEDADDPAANLAAAVYICLIKGEWQGGAPFLAKSQHAKLTQLAAKELAKPQDAPAQLELADAWYAYGKGGDNLLEIRGLVRARYWYSRARIGVTGLNRTRVEKTLEQIRAELTDSGWSIRATL